MKMLLNEFLELNLSDLIVINGGASGSYSGSGSTKPDHYSAETGWESGWGPSGYTGSTKPDHYSAETGWEPGWGPEGYTGTPTTGTCSGSTKSDPVPSATTPTQPNDPQSNPDIVDRSKNPYVIAALDCNGFRLLSESNPSGYSAGSERAYYQESYTNFLNNPDFVVTSRTADIEGSPSAGFGVEDYTIYTVASRDGQVALRLVDVNNDGVMDYVHK